MKKYESINLTKNERNKLKEMLNKLKADNKQKEEWQKIKNNEKETLQNEWEFLMSQDKDE